MKGTREYVNAAQKTRTVCRQLTCKDGFCLIVEKDETDFRLIQRVLKTAGIESQYAEDIDCAISTLRDKAKSIICAVIDCEVNGTGTGEDVVREIEKHHGEIPYIVYTDNKRAASRLADHFPRANIVLKGCDVDRLIDALGVKA